MYEWKEEKVEGVRRRKQHNEDGMAKKALFNNVNDILPFREFSLVILQSSHSSF